MGKLKQLSDSRPIFIGLILLLLSLLLRINDIFVLKIDELWGEIIISKALGFLLILLYLFLIKRSAKSIGLHSENIGKNLFIGFAAISLVYLIGYISEYIILLLSKSGPDIVISAIDPKQGVNGGVIFAFWLIFGNIINSFMEEGLFRGLLIPKLMTKFSFWHSNLLQSFLFGLWHLVWPVKDILMGKQNITEGLIAGAVIFIGTVINGVILGYMYYKTNSLWTPWIAHTLTNSILNLIHINSNISMDAMMTVRVTAALILGLLSLFVIKIFADRFKMNQITTWDI